MSRTTRTRWTPEETEALRRNYPIFGSDTDSYDCEWRRSKTATNNKASSLGLHVNGYEGRWTRHEDDVVRHNYPTYGTDVSRWDEKLDRTTAAIGMRANKLGVFIEGYELEKRHGELRNAVRLMCDRMGCSVHVLIKELRTMQHRGDL